MVNEAGGVRQAAEMGPKERHTENGHCIDRTYREKFAGRRRSTLAMQGEGEAVGVGLVVDDLLCAEMNWVSTASAIASGASAGPRMAAARRGERGHDCGVRGASRGVRTGLKVAKPVSWAGGLVPVGGGSWWKGTVHGGR